MGVVVNDILKYFEGVYGKLEEAVHFEQKVVLNELLLNAVKHSRKDDGEDQVHVLAWLEDSQFAMVEVEDSGDGYDTELYNEMEKAGMIVPESIEDLKEGGRGIILVKYLSDDFKVSKKGNKVLVRKNLSFGKTTSQKKIYRSERDAGGARHTVFS